MRGETSQEFQSFGVGGCTQSTQEMIGHGGKSWTSEHFPATPQLSADHIPPTANTSSGRILNQSSQSPIHINPHTPSGHILNHQASPSMAHNSPSLNSPQLQHPPSSQLYSDEILSENSVQMPYYSPIHNSSPLLQKTSQTFRRPSPLTTSSSHHVQSPVQRNKGQAKTTLNFENEAGRGTAEEEVTISRKFCEYILV